MIDPFKPKPYPGEMHSSSIIRRYEGNPLLTKDDVPYPATLVFNAGVIKYRDLYYIAPRVDLFDEEYNTPALNISTGFGLCFLSTFHTLRAAVSAASARH